MAGPEPPQGLSSLAFVATVFGWMGYFLALIVLLAAAMLGWIPLLIVGVPMFSPHTARAATNTTLSASINATSAEVGDGGGGGSRAAGLAMIVIGSVWGFAAFVVYITRKKGVSARIRMHSWMGLL